MIKTRKVKKLLKKYFTYWAHWTGLGYWNVHLRFENEVKDGPGETFIEGHCQADWRYQFATITFYPKAMRHLAAAEIESAVVHELVHVFLCEMREDGIDHEERTATQLEKAFLWVKNARAK